MEVHHLFRNTMFKFRKDLSAQDFLLQLKEEVINNCSHKQTKAIPAPDLKRALNNIKDERILENLQSLHGGRTYHYIHNFLGNCTATLYIGDLQSFAIPIGSRGIPQDFVISHFLFNIGLLSLSSLRELIPWIHHGLYPDDISICATSGLELVIQNALQQVADPVNTLVKSCSLVCSAEKADQLIVSKKAQTPERSTNITATWRRHGTQHRRTSDPVTREH